MEENNLTRRQAREHAFLAAFSVTFQPDEPQEALRSCGEMQEIGQDAFTAQLLQALTAHSAEIDAEITAHLKGWTLSRLPRVSLTAMRIALAEMLYGAEKKPAVAINEAVELVKKYGAENDYQFVNGLLGSVAREHGLVDTEPASC
ncbi:MAG TPA: transcription antitermination factor NusB [Candidatus Gemmiger faecigallinarum]|nr:transcription antitermination factor NusB [Candidatus Gemmiger faecigallinarum]